MVFAKTFLENNTVMNNNNRNIFLDFEIQTELSIPVRRADLVLIKKKNTCNLVDFTIQADSRVFFKRTEKRNIRVTVVPIMVSVLGMVVSRVLVNGPRDLGSIPGRIVLKTLKMVLDTSLLCTQ